MTKLPEWLDYVHAENSAARLIRGVSKEDDANPGEILASAQLILSHYQEVRLLDATLLYEEKAAMPLIAAARSLDSLSQNLNIAQPIRIDLALTAASAFSLYGNFPSATACIRRLHPQASPDSEVRWAIIGTLAPELLTRGFSNAPQSAREYLHLLESFLLEGREDIFNSTLACFSELMRRPMSPFEGGLMRSSRATLAHIWHLSAARVLNSSQSLEREYVQKLVQSGLRLLLPPQRKALVEQNLISTRRNRLISLPTSTGKTLLGEWCIVSALRGDDDIGCYLAPYVALGRQVADSIRRHLPDSYKTISLIPGTSPTNQSIPETGRHVIVATPERFDLLLRCNPGLRERLRCVVVDEAHLIENDTRGARLEGIVARLRLMQKEQGETKLSLILLSAVLPSYDTLKSWMNIDDQGIITNSWRPTARRLAFWRQDGVLSWHYGGDPVRPAGVRGSELVGNRLVPWPNNKFYPAKHYGQIKQQQDALNTNIAHLIKTLLDDFGEPILCVCATKEGTRKLASSIALALKGVRKNTSQSSKLASYIEEKHPHLTPLAELIRHQVAYHNSVLPHDIREMIEEGVKSKDILVVASTTTLAEGIDLPFRFSVIADWLVWRDIQQAPMSALLFRNIAGRCGRAGVFTEGDTIVIDNPIGEEKLVSPLTRAKLQAQIFFADGPGNVSSALEEASDSTTSFGVRAEIASQFLAAIPENPHEEDLVEAFTNNSLAGQRSKRPSVIKLLSNLRADLLNPAFGAMAVANSPLRLTPLGQKANTTGFSPESCRRIIATLARMPATTSALDAADYLLQQLGTLPEQSNGDWRKILEDPKSKFVVKKPDLRLVLTQWLSGEEDQDVFAILPYSINSKASVSVRDWRTGAAQSAEWDRIFDKFSEFKTSVLQGFAPWLMKTCSTMSEEIGGWTQEAPWMLWGEMLEFGVNSKWAVEATKRRIPVSRKTIVEAASHWPPELTSPNDVLGLRLLSTQSARNLAIKSLMRSTLLNSTDSTYNKEALVLIEWIVNGART